MTEFGPHLFIDSPTYLTPNQLRSVSLWERFLIRLVERAEMRVLHGPVVVDSSCSNAAWDPPNVTGLSGFVVLAESHASFHTFAESQFVFLDVFSCKTFPDGFTDWIRDELWLLDPQIQTVPRFWR